MAPSKKATKTKSAPNTTAANLLKALKRNNSVETGGVNKKAKKKLVLQPSPQDSSPQSIKKKAISTRLQQQLNKKRKRVEEPVASKEGIKLLKRGAVTMHRIIRRKMLGVKKTVSFNAKGEPYGTVATEMQSYIGVLARTKAPIWYENWKRVPKERKNKIWDCVQVKPIP